MNEVQLEQLKEETYQCTKCALSASRHHVVFGEGNPNAEIMFIGEGPGREEDLSGHPFVGRSGQMLDKILEACGFKRNKHIYIGNIVKCRPPGNRAPLPDERAACLPYLYKQIMLIDPKIIVLLGGTALNGLIDPNLKISRTRGNWIQWNSRWVMPVFHPAALLHNEGLKRPTWEDFKKIVFKYRELIDPEHFSKYI